MDNRLRMYRPHDNDANDIIEKDASPKAREVAGAFGTKQQVIATGSAIIPSDENVTLPNVLVLPNMKRKLISVAKLLEEGYEVHFEGKECVVTDNGKKIITAKIDDTGLYTVLERKHTPKIANLATTLANWHKRLGHTSADKIKELAKSTPRSKFKIPTPRLNVRPASSGK